MDSRRSTVAAIATVLTVVALLAACGRGAIPGDPDSGVRGVVLMGPMCPVIREGDPCPEQPFVGRVLAVGDRGSVEAETDEAGNFTLALPPGTYTVTAVLEDGGPPTAIPQILEVHRGVFTGVTLQVDTGIR